MIYVHILYILYYIYLCTYIHTHIITRQENAVLRQRVAEVAARLREFHRLPEDAQPIAGLPRSHDALHAHATAADTNAQQLGNGSGAAGGGKKGESTWMQGLQGLQVRRVALV